MPSGLTLVFSCSQYCIPSFYFIVLFIFICCVLPCPMRIVHKQVLQTSCCSLPWDSIRDRKSFSVRILKTFSSCFISFSVDGEKSEPFGYPSLCIYLFFPFRKIDVSFACDIVKFNSLYTIFYHSGCFKDFLLIQSTHIYHYDVVCCGVFIIITYARYKVGPYSNRCCTTYRMLHKTMFSSNEYSISSYLVLTYQYCDLLPSKFWFTTLHHYHLFKFSFLYWAYILFSSLAVLLEVFD